MASPVGWTIREKRDPQILVVSLDRLPLSTRALQSNGILFGSPPAPGPVLPADGAAHTGLETPDGPPGFILLSPLHSDPWQRATSTGRPVAERTCHLNS